MSPAVPTNVKPSLPKDWIVVTSKTHPNRVYYFNVRTNKSSWESPLPYKANKALQSKKRKTEQGDEDGLLRPTTPENDVESKTKPHERKKLRAKRTVAPTEPMDTPQMREIREKLLQKQAKAANANKKSVPIVKKTDKVAPKPGTAKSKSQTKSKKDTVSVYNEEMLAVYEKMQQRQSKSSASKKSNSSKSSDKQSQSTKQSLLTGVSSTGSTTSSNTNSTSTTNTNSTSVQNASIPKKVNTSSATVYSTKSGNTARNGSGTSGTSLSNTVLSNVKNNAEPEGRSLRTRKNISTVSDSTDQSIGTLSNTSNNVTKTQKIKKNIAKDRLDILNASLQMEQQKQKLAMSMKSAKEKSDNIISILDSPPSIYKNAVLRHKSLRSKVLRSSKIKQDFIEKEKSVEANDSYNKPVTGIGALLRECHEEQSFYEEMEWSPIEDEKIMSEVQNVRVQLGTQAWDEITINTPKNDLEFPMTRDANNKDLYIIIDTNVFLSNIQAVEQARDAVFKSYGRPIIVVPWTVLRELDYIKDNNSESLQAKARRAIRFLYQHFSDKHPRVKGQTASDFERNKAQFAFDCPDDEILQTCLQVAQSGHTVVLLSYDINLCNKAMIHDILTLGRNDPLEKIDFLNAIESINETRTLQYDLNDNGEYYSEPVSNFDREKEMSDEILEEAKAILKKFLSIIVAKEMQNLYGDPWEKHTIIHPPWSPIDVLKCAVKHWMAAVSESFIRRAENILKELLENFKQPPDQGRKLRDVSHILERCSDLVQCAKQDKYPQLVQTTMANIMKLKKTCQEFIRQINEEQFRTEFGPEIEAEEQERRAEIVFKYFHDIYSYACNRCGLAAKLKRIPCDIAYETPDPMPSAEHIKEIQPELAANVNRLRTALSSALQQVNALHIKHGALILLREALVNFLPESDQSYSDISLLDLYYCLKRKESSLKIGLAQLHNLSIHFCRIASASSG
ncbi:transcriptional protein SWT1 isoform X1 [Cephus cinctus]|uniref:Transcriptional protein SWT1 isoform X1 n=1 Tax=Cephus cinctus TaxID=211228 RepID=A0AAJ7R939_CEPCN|nr:transcriptional protein SWT1 isoform X1 [Cephus cinctus]